MNIDPISIIQNNKKRVDSNTSVGMGSLNVVIFARFHDSDLSDRRGATCATSTVIADHRLRDTDIVIIFAHLSDLDFWGYGCVFLHRHAYDQAENIVPKRLAKDAKSLNGPRMQPGSHSRCPKYSFERGPCGYICTRGKVNVDHK